MGSRIFGRLKLALTSHSSRQMERGAPATSSKCSTDETQEKKVRMSMIDLRSSMENGTSA